MNLTKPQELIYNMEKFSGGSISVICGSMLVKGNKNLSEMKEAVNELYRLNDALRIRITETDKGVEQYISDYSEQNIKVLNFADKSELNAYAENYAKTPIDLYGDLCEINIVILPEWYGLIVKFHHIVGDAWSLSLIGNQFITLLTGETPIAYSYADYVQSENNYLSSRRYDKDKDFFLEQFKKCDEVTYLNEKQSDTLNANRKTFVIDSDKTKQIIGYAQQKDTSAFILFTAALSSYINRTKMNAEKFYIGTAVLNRSSVKEKNTMGMFITEDNITELLDNSNSLNPSVTMKSENLCYCIYTSGSTGKPKGTLLRHQGIVNLVTNLSIYKDLSNCERFGFMTTITFDVATQEILTSLLNGFTGVLMPERKYTRAEEIIDKLEEYK